MLTAGIALLVSGIKGHTVADVLRGALGEDNPIFNRINFAQAANAEAAGNLPPSGANVTTPNLRGGKLLRHLAQTAQDQFHLKVHDFLPFDPVDEAVHVSGSYHLQNRAFDASGSETEMRAFTDYVRENYGRHVTELIHNPGGSIKRGRAVAPGFWGSQTWAGHRNHVHVAI